MCDVSAVVMMDSGCHHPVGFSLEGTMERQLETRAETTSPCVWKKSEAGTAEQKAELKPRHLKLSFQPFAVSCFDRMQGVARG